jgi:D-glycero-D-manno-heptose 1,7-bisphosphate phosphatase
MYQYIEYYMYSTKGASLMKLIILDKDGTLTAPKSGNPFVQYPEDQILLPGVLAGLRHYSSQGHKLAIASNQGGVAAGHKTLRDAIAEMRFCLTLCEELVDAAFFCPDYDEFYAVGPNGVGFPDNHCCFNIAEILGWEESRSVLNTGYFRKPGPGMLKFAIKDAGATEALMIGDRPEDQQAAAAAGIDFRWADEWRREHL